MARMHITGVGYLCLPQPGSPIPETVIKNDCSRDLAPRGSHGSNHTDRLILVVVISDLWPFVAECHCSKGQGNEEMETTRLCFPSAIHEEIGP